MNPEAARLLNKLFEQNSLPVIPVGSRDYSGILIANLRELINLTKEKP